MLKTLGNHQFYCVRSGKSSGPTPEGVKEIGSLKDAFRYGIDAALVTNPTSCHIETAAELALQGIPLFIEKPLGKDLAGIEELQKAVESTKIPVLMGYNLLHHPGIRLMGELIETGNAGKVIAARSQFGTYMPGWHKGEDHTRSYAALKSLGGGVVLTSIHEQNYLTHFFGKVMEVKAMKTEFNTTGIECEEGVEILLKHESGVLSSIHLNFFQKPYRRYFEAIGTEGTLYWDFMKPEVRLMNNDTMLIRKAGAGAFELLNESYRNQMLHFMGVANGLEKPVAGLDAGIRDMEVALKILKETGVN